MWTAYPLETNPRAIGVRALDVKKPKMIAEFKEFIFKGNVLELATAVILGLALSGVINSLVNDVIMPPIGMALGGADFRDIYVVLKDGPGNATAPYESLGAAQADGAVTWRIGMFVNAVINFVIIAFVIFLIVKAANKAKRKKEAGEPTEKDCPRCMMKIPIKATRCAHCTSDIA
jgi:large conductance mechanosensitive channel